MTFKQILSLIIITVSYLNGGLAQIVPTKYNYQIPVGQALYTMHSKNISNLKPYKLTYEELFNGDTTMVIETGDYVVRRISDGAQLTLDTLYFAISKIAITGQDTVKTMERIELKKYLSFPMKAHLVFTEDKIYVYPSPNDPIYKSIKNTKEFVHIDDKELYFKRFGAESLKFKTTKAAFSLMTIPFRIRLLARSDAEETAEFKFNNLGVFLGFKTINFIHKNGQLKQRSFSIGPFAGLSIVELNNKNSELTTTAEIHQMGSMAGLNFMGHFNRLDIGTAFGVETIRNNENNWMFNGKAFWGVVIGYSLNAD